MTTDNMEPMEDGVQPQIEANIAAAAADAAQRTFSQDEVNRLQGQARRDERAKYGDYQQLKERAHRADELEAAQLSDAEKMEARAVDAERRAADAQAQIASTMIAAEVKVRAGQMGIVDPDAAFLLLDKSSVSYDASAGVSGVDYALTQLLEAKPCLKGGNRTPNINPEGGAAVPVIRLTDEQREMARMMGMNEEEYAQGLQI